MSRRRFTEPVLKQDSLDAIETFAKPLKTMLDNFKAGQITAENRAATFEAIEQALELLRVAYCNIQHSGAK